MKNTTSSLLLIIGCLTGINTAFASSDPGPSVLNWCIKVGGNYYTEGEFIVDYAGIANRGDKAAQYSTYSMITMASSDGTSYNAYISDKSVDNAAKIAFLTHQKFDACTLGTGGSTIGDKNSRFLVGINLRGDE